MSARLFVDNLPEGITEEALRVLFSRGGTSVMGVSIMSDRKSHGYAFVEMTTPADAAQAIRALHGQLLRELQFGRRREQRHRAHPSEIVARRIDERGRCRASSTAHLSDSSLWW